MDARDLDSKEALEAVCYPRVVESCYKRLYRLQSVGLEKVCVKGPVKIASGIGVLGKGHASIVSAFQSTRWGIVAVKSKRIDSRRRTMVKEALRIKEASRAGVAPRVYYYDDDLIVMEYIEGPTLEELMQIQGGLTEWIIFSTLKSARILDIMGILHLEIHRPWKNIMYNASQASHAYIIDYDSTSRDCGNVVKVLSGLSRYSWKLVRMTSNLAIRRMFSAYKKQGCPDKLYHRILSHVKKYME